MLRFCCLFMVCAMLLASCGNRSNPSAANHTIDTKWKKISDSWIEKAKRFNYNRREDTSLISEFSKLIGSDTIPYAHTEHVDPDYGRIFNEVSIDLDSDGQAELICLQGWDVYRPVLCLFKQIDGNWYLIYKEQIDTFYGSPTIYVANNYSRNKTFYLRRVYNHGSGVYVDGYSFYKLIDNQVYHCLDIVNDAHIYGWGLFMNQAVKSDFDFRGDMVDEISVNYSYNFFPGSMGTGDCSWCTHEDTPLIKGEDNVTYTYNSKKHKYIFEAAPYQNSATDLTEEKIKCFGDFGNDSLFVHAYRRQIDTVLKMGSPLQKKILKKYLRLVKKDKVAITEELEPKTNNTTLYGPEK